LEQVIKPDWAVVKFSVDEFEKAFLNSSRFKPKRYIFLQGEVFFLLTRPLIVDPRNPYLASFYA